MIRFKRQLSDKAFEYLQNDGQFIIPEIKSVRKDLPFILDIQLRENDQLMVYMGTTCLLTVKINIKKKELKCSAYITYSDPFLRTYKFTDPPRGKIAVYLQDTITKVHSKYFNNKMEGYYQNMICFKYGAQADPNAPFTIIDRECVIGHDSDEKKTKLIDPIRKKYQSIKDRLQEGNPRKWGKKASDEIPENGKKRKKEFGDELDILGIDKDLNLLCIELKHGSNSGIHWSPLQVAVYKELYSDDNLLSFLFNDIKILVEQKIILKLLPLHLDSILFKKDRFNSVKSFLVIGAPEHTSPATWGKMKEVINENSTDLTCPIIVVDENGVIANKTI